MCKPLFSMPPCLKKKSFMGRYKGLKIILLVGLIICFKDVTETRKQKLITLLGIDQTACLPCPNALSVHLFIDL